MVALSNTWYGAMDRTLKVRPHVLMLHSNEAMEWKPLRLQNTHKETHYDGGHIVIFYTHDNVLAVCIRWNQPSHEHSVYLPLKAIEPESYTSLEQHQAFSKQMKMYSILPVLISWACVFYFVAQVIRDNKLKKLGKTAWSIFLVVFNMVALPIWVIYAKFR